MKCATPTWPALSSRDPASTYAAIETERAAGSRALMTRGPEGSAVRSNIVRMVPDCRSTPGGTGRAVPTRRDPSRRTESDEPAPQRTILRGAAGVGNRAVDTIARMPTARHRRASLTRVPDER